MAGVITTNPKIQFSNAAGIPLVGGTVTVYLAGTTTLSDTWFSKTLTNDNKNTNPIVLDSRGECVIWLDPLLVYKFVLTDAQGNVQWTVDNIAGAEQAGLEASSGSNRIGFIQAGTGAVARTVQSKLRDTVSVFDFGAVGNGSTDDTVAIQNALNTGKAVMIPGGGYSYKITSALEPVSGQLVMGDGLPTVRQYTTDLPVFDIDGCTDVVIDGIVCYAIGTMTAYTSGNGVRARGGCERIAVRNCVIKNHRGFGILLWDTIDSEASGNVLIDSPVSNSDNHTQAAGDICLLGEAQNNNVFGNRCISGNGIGVNIQSFGSVTTCSNNTITGNVIRDCKMYGVNVYGLDPTDFVYNNTITGNSIRNITGAVAHQTLGYIFGNGIYCVAAQETTITGNSIKETHSGAVVFVNLLAPASIGAIECGRIVITGNSCDDDQMWGITVRDPNAAALAVGFSEISSNTISNITNDGIHVFQTGRVNVTGNSIDTVGGNGVYVQNTVTKRPSISVTGNTIRNAGGSGIRATYFQQSAVANNVIHTTAVHGIAIDFSTDVGVNGNTVRDHVVYGIIVEDSDTYAMAGNVVHGNGASLVGYFLLSRGQVSRANEVTGCVTAWNGTYRLYQGAAPASGTWQVGDIVYYTAPATGLPIGFVCTVAGTPGTWFGYGVVL